MHPLPGGGHIKTESSNSHCAREYPAGGFSEAGSWTWPPLWDEPSFWNLESIIKWATMDKSTLQAKKYSLKKIFDSMMVLYKARIKEQHQKVWDEWAGKPGGWLPTWNGGSYARKVSCPYTSLSFLMLAMCLKIKQLSLSQCFSHFSHYNPCKEYVLQHHSVLSPIHITETKVLQNQYSPSCLRCALIVSNLFHHSSFFSAGLTH